MTITTREQAKQKRKTRYYTGKSCKYGHFRKGWWSIIIVSSVGKNDANLKSPLRFAGTALGHVKAHYFVTVA